MKRVVTSTFGALSNPLLFKALARRFALGRVNVVYYHYVGDTVSYYGEFYRGCTVERFRRDLEALRKVFEIVPLTKVVEFNLGMHAPQIPYLAVGVLVFLIVVFGYALAEHLQIMHRWLDRPYMLVFPVLGAAAASVLAASVRYRWDGLPFSMVTLIFVTAFATLALSFWPYMIPGVVTIEQAAAPPSSLAFMFWGEGLFVFPLMLIYAIVSYSVFRGKLGATAEHY